VLKRIETRCVAASRVIAILAVGGMLALALLTVADIALRFFFNAPITGLFEAAQLLMAVIVIAALPVGIMERNHVTIDLFEGLLGPRWSKMGEAIGAVCLLVFIAVLAWRFGIHAERLMRRGDTTMIVGIPIAPFWWAVAAIIGACALLQIVALATTWREAAERFADRTLDGRGRSGALLVVGSLIATFAMFYEIGVNGRTMGASGLAMLAFAAIWMPIVMLVPVAVAMAAAGLVGAAVLTSPEVSLNSMVLQISSFLGNFNVSVLPLFLMMGSFAAVADLSEDVYRLAHALFGRLKGGLAMATIGGCAGFGAVTGSSVATAATIGRVALPEMQARGYAPTLSTGCVAAGGTLGALVPPGSGPLVIFGLLTEASIGQLFIASLLPAILAVALYLITIWAFVRVWPNSAPAAAAPERGELIAAARRCGPVAFLFAVVLGGLYLGVFTVTESAAVGAATAFFVAMWRGKLRRDTFLAVIGETTRTTAMIYILIFGALVFSYFTGLTGVAETWTKAVTALGWPPIAVIALLLLVFLALGTFMDSWTIMIVTVPIVTPLITGMGYDLIWWGILMLCVVETGSITPPFGLNMFVLKNIGNVSMAVVFAGVLPFVAADVVRIAILAIFPSISLWLPSTMFD
jgi:tripartite ATP-independent transporter DctM subunit